MASEEGAEACNIPDDVIAELAYEVLELDDCEQLARRFLKIKEVVLKRILQDDINFRGHANKMIEILHTWTRQEGHSATVSVLASHISKLSLSSDQMDKAQELLKVDIQEKARWVTELQPQSVLEYSTAVFSCETNHQDLPVKWYSRGERIAPTNDRFEISQDSKQHKLVIREVNKSDEGEIRAIVQDTKTQTVLQVEEQKITIKLNNLEVFSGQNAEFVCEVSPDVAPTQWFVNDQEVSDREKYQLGIHSNRRTLTIFNCTEEDTGTVRAVVGEKTSEARLTVTELKFISGLENKTVFEGDSVIFQCRVNHENEPVQWFVNDKLVQDDQQFSMISQDTLRQLHINDIQMEEAGNVRVEVGHIRSLGYLQVRARPSWQQELETQSVTEHMTATFVCVTNHDDLEVSWELNGQAVGQSGKFQASKRGTEHTLKIHDVQITDEGDVKASFGRLTSEAELLVQDANTDSHTPADMQLLLIGKTGNGKSATGNTILRRPKAFKSGKGPVGVTRDVNVKSSRGQPCKIKVCDTPGLFDKSFSMNKIIIKIFESFESMPPGPHAILVALKASARYSDEEHAAIQKLKDLFGEDVMKYVVICLTHADDTSEDDYLSDNTITEFLICSEEVNNRIVSFDNLHPNTFDLQKLQEVVDDIKEKNPGSPFFTVPNYREALAKYREQDEKDEQEFKKSLHFLEKYLTGAISEKDEVLLIEMCREIMKIEQDLRSVLADWLNIRREAIKSVEELMTFIPVHEAVQGTLAATAGLSIGLMLAIWAIPATAGISALAAIGLGAGMGVSGATIGTIGAKGVVVKDTKERLEVLAHFDQKQTQIFQSEIEAVDKKIEHIKIKYAGVIEKISSDVFQHFITIREVNANNVEGGLFKSTLEAKRIIGRKGLPSSETLGHKIVVVASFALDLFSSQLKENRTSKRQILALFKEELEFWENFKKSMDASRV